MDELEQMRNALVSVEKYLRNQELSEIGMQVKGKVLQALEQQQSLPIDSVRNNSDAKCGKCGDVCEPCKIENELDN